MIMTVRVINRDKTLWGTPNYYDNFIKTVEISDSCPVCGEKRGKPYEHSFYEDGEPALCDRWDNPCGHVDKYEDCIKESERE